MFGKLDIPLIRITDTKNGFNAITDDQNHIDKILSPPSVKVLNEINLQPVIPPELKSRRTVFVRQLDHSVGSRPENEIKNEIESNHDYVKVAAVHKIKHYTHLLKIECTQTQMADRILENGLILFNTRVTPSQTEREKYIHILICFKCYKFEDHSTNQCMSTQVVCSECAEVGHTHHNCTSQTKKCLNCTTNNDHRTFAGRYPYRKQAEAKKQQKTNDQITTKNNQTFASIAKSAIEQTIEKTKPPPSHPY